MVFAIILIFFITAFFAFFEEKLGKFKWYVYIFIGISLILLAAIRPVGVDNDSVNYEKYFFHYDSSLYETTVEASYMYLSKIFYRYFGDVHSIFFFYAFVGVILKMEAFRKMTELPFLALCIYICTYYILHEFTQIRIGISSGILLFIIYQLKKGKRKNAILLILVSLVFHYSSVMLLPLLFLSNNDLNINEKKLWGSLVFLGYAFYFLHFGLSLLPIPYLADKLQAYQDLKDQGFLDEVNVFNIVYLVKIIIFYYILFYYDTIKNYNDSLPIMIKMESISLFSFTALSSLPVLSFRVSELYGIVEIILYANIFYTIRPKWLSKLIVSFIGLTLLAIAIFYNKLIQLS